YFLPDLFRRTLIWAKTRFRYQFEIANMLRLPANGPAILVTDAGGRESLDLVRTAADRVTHFLVPDGSGGPEVLVRQGQQVLARGDVVGLCVDDTPGTALLLSELLREGAPVLPVHYAEMTRGGKQEVVVMAGSLLAPGCRVDVVREELRRVQQDLEWRI